MRGRSADPFGTAVRMSSTMRFEHGHGRGLSGTTDDEFELRISQVRVLLRTVAAGFPGADDGRVLEMARRKRSDFEEGASAAAISGTTLVVEKDEISKYGGA